MVITAPVTARHRADQSSAEKNAGANRCKEHHAIAPAKHAGRSHLRAFPEVRIGSGLYESRAAKPHCSKYRDRRDENAPR